MTETQVLQLLSALGVLLFALGAFLCFWLMRRPWTRGKRYIERGGHARGVVVRHVPTGETESGNTMYSDEIEFQDRTGRAFRIIAFMASTHPTTLIGTQVEVAYDVGDPSKGVVIGGARTLALIGTGVSAVFALLAGASAVGFVALLL